MEEEAGLKQLGLKVYVNYVIPLAAFLRQGL